MDSTFSRYSPGFYHSSVLTQIRPFSGTRRECFLMLARILLFFNTPPDSTIFQYSDRFDPFPLFTGKDFRCSHGFYLFPGTHLDIFSILARIVPFPGTHPDSTIFGTPTDSSLFRYSRGQFFDMMISISPISRELPSPKVDQGSPGMIFIAG